MKLVVSKYNNIVTAVLPLAFLGAGYLNTIMYPLGLHGFDTVRTIITFSILGCITLLLLGKVIMLWKQEEHKKFFSRAIWIPVLFCVLYIIALVIRPDKLMILKKAVVDGNYLLCACCALCVIIAERRLVSFLKACRVYAIMLLPVLLFYCIRFYVSDQDYEIILNLRAVDYMTLAYLTVNLCIALFGEMMLLTYSKSSKKVTMLIDGALLVFFTIVVTFTACKGAIVCQLVGFFAVALYYILAKLPKKQMVIVLILCALSIVLFSSILAPNTGSDNRIIAFFKELAGQNENKVSLGGIKDAMNDDLTASTEGTVPGGQTRPETPTVGDEMTPPTVGDETTQPDSKEDPLTITEVIDYISSGRLQQDYDAGKITQEKYDEFMMLYQNFVWSATGTRTYLWSCAIDEIRNEPLTGQGVFFYQSKYGVYPHNFFLELAADFGLPVMVFCILLGVYVFLKLLRMSLKNASLAVFMLYVLTLFFQNMVSGSIYDFVGFVQYGFCIIFACSKLPSTNEA